MSDSDKMSESAPDHATLWYLYTIHHYADTRTVVADKFYLF